MPFILHLLTDGRYTIKWTAGAQRGEAVVQVQNYGKLAAGVKDQLEADGVPLFLTEPCDSSLYAYSNEALRPWYDREDCHARLDTLLETNKVPPELEHPFRHFLNEGWLEIENHLDAALLERLNAAMDHAAANGESGLSAVAVSACSGCTSNIKRSGMSPRIQKRKRWWTA